MYMYTAMMSGIHIYIYTVYGTFLGFASSLTILVELCCWISGHIVIARTSDLRQHLWSFVPSLCAIIFSCGAAPFFFP